MIRLCPFQSAISVFLLLPIALQAQASTDVNGDPLPTGAVARLGSLRYRSGDSAGGFALSPDGGLIATGETNHVRLFATATGKETALIPVEGKLIVKVIFSADGKRLLAHALHHPMFYIGPDMSESIYVVDVATGKVLMETRDATLGFREVALGGDGAHFVVRYHKPLEGNSPNAEALAVWSVADKKKLYQLPPPACWTVSPDGKQLATAAADGTIQVRELASRKEVLVIRPGAQGIASLIIAPDGRSLASAGSDRTIHIWDLATGKEKAACIGHETALLGARFAPDGQSLISEDTTRVVRVWDAPTGKQRQMIPKGGGRYRTWAVAPDSQSLAWSWEDGVIHHCELATGKELRSWGGAQGWTSALAFTPDGKQLVSKGNSICVWDVTAGKELQDYQGHRAGIRSLLLSPDGRFVLSTDDGRGVRLWEAMTGKPAPPLTAATAEKTIRGHFTADGKWLTTVTLDTTVRVWELGTGKMLRQFRVGTEATVREWEKMTNDPPGFLELHDKEQHCLVFSASGQLLAVAGEDQVIRIYDLRSGEKIGELVGHKGRLGRMVFAGTDKLLVSRAEDGTVRIWELADGKSVHQFSYTAGRGGLFSFSPKGTMMAVTEREKIILYDLATRKELRTLSGHRGFTNSIGFDRDGAMLATAGEDQTIRYWDTATGQELRAIAGNLYQNRDVSFFQLPNGRLMARASGEAKGSVYTLREMLTGREIAKVHRESRRAGESHAVSPDGRTLATGLEQVVFREWATGSVLGQLPAGHRGKITALAFSADGSLLATGSADTTILLWKWTTAIGLVPPPAAELEEHWQALAGTDARRAGMAVQGFVAAGDRGVAFLRDRLKPATAAEVKAIRQLVLDLDSDDFAIREKASEELLKLGAEAVPILQKSLPASPSVEAARRIESLLHKPELGRWNAESLRRLRALQSLELLGTPAARAVLEQCAVGPPDAWLTAETQEALGRLARAKR